MNDEIREHLRQQRVYRWEVARELGMHESAFSKWFREELTDDQKKKIHEAVKRIKNNMA